MLRLVAEEEKLLRPQLPRRRAHLHPLMRKADHALYERLPALRGGTSRHNLTSLRISGAVGLLTHKHQLARLEQRHHAVSRNTHEPTV